MKFEEPEVVEVGLAEELIQIVDGPELENPPFPTPTKSAGPVYIPEGE